MLPLNVFVETYTYLTYAGYFILALTVLISLYSLIKVSKNLNLEEVLLTKMDKYFVDHELGLPDKEQYVKINQELDKCRKELRTFFVALVAFVVIFFILIFILF